MYNFMTLTKKKKKKKKKLFRSGGFLRSVGRGQSNNLFFLALPRPIGTNLVLVQRVRANNLLSMKAERAKPAERLTAWGPWAHSRAPDRGPGGRAPGSSWVLAFEKAQKGSL